jgi:hypothetical protein
MGLLLSLLLEFPCIHEKVRTKLRNDLRAQQDFFATLLT